MKPMRKSLAVLAAAAAILSLPAGYAAADHIATPDAVQSRLSEASAQRAQDLATVQDVLSTPLAREAAASVGADLARVRAGVGTLSDAELSDLAARASALQGDPVAGAMDRNMRLLVMIGLILAIIIMLAILL
jgi:pyruvate/2-oxoglutarate dehydrogenase complex dihydrolipoamide acyltransferase (E2) component